MTPDTPLQDAVTLAADLRRMNKQSVLLRLDHKGRCCGRKPIVYRRPSFRYFCSRCTAEFGPNCHQRSNWAWREAPDGGFLPVQTIHPSGDASPAYVKLLAATLPKSIA